MIKAQKVDAKDQPLIEVDLPILQDVARGRDALGGIQAEFRGCLIRETNSWTSEYPKNQDPTACCCWSSAGGAMGARVVGTESMQRRLATQKREEMVENGKSQGQMRTLRLSSHLTKPGFNARQVDQNERKEERWRKKAGWTELDWTKLAQARIFFCLTWIPVLSDFRQTVDYVARRGMAVLPKVVYGWTTTEQPGNPQSSYRALVHSYLTSAILGSVARCSPQFIKLHVWSLPAAVSANVAWARDMVKSSLDTRNSGFSTRGPLWNVVAPKSVYDESEKGKVKGTPQPAARPAASWTVRHPESADKRGRKKLSCLLISRGLWGGKSASSGLWSRLDWLGKLTVGGNKAASKANKSIQWRRLDGMTMFPGSLKHGKWKAIGSHEWALEQTRYLHRCRCRYARSRAKAALILILPCSSQVPKSNFTKHTARAVLSGQSFRVDLDSRVPIRPFTPVWLSLESLEDGFQRPRDLQSFIKGFKRSERDFTLTLLPTRL
ncbi:uncharacterized protein CLUP02_03772 [Colletotrichum lupini]|uniref:Uncharacterized protein n=1 Tax=Colletotrichum lupini TaxID=145971 RepID=A0A9Q8SJY9_9PEZI|nr:uncharacterized protein CLUP02_03772 [Colletotrichum lupini]UQC78295.1 hypothetical protein CLUP02_03772 [Colletotrichum lupini]